MERERDSLDATFEQVEQLKMYGFSEIYVHDIPFGVVFNAQNADSFPVVSTGSYLHQEKQLMIERDVFHYNNNIPWRMITLHNDRRSDGGFFVSKEGTIPELLEASKSIAKP